MRYALLVALREYVENAKTKGFWIGIMMFPIILVIAIRVPQFLEKRATPTRHFLLIDQTGDFDAVVSEALRRFEQRNMLKALNFYAAKHARRDAAAGGIKDIDLERIPASMLNPERFLDEFADNNPQALEAFTSKGGKAFFLAQIQGILEENAPPFQDPKTRFRRVALPPELDPDQEIGALAEFLKPYLTGKKKIEYDGKSVELFAAVLIPRDIEEKVYRAEQALVGLDSDRGGIEFWSANLADDALSDQIERSVNDEIQRREFVSRGMNADVVSEVQKTRVPIVALNPKKEAGQEEVSLADVMRQWAPVGFVYLLWIAIFTISQMLLQNTIEEKSNRIIEVLLSSVTPRELMTGKLIGIAAIGITMLGAWMIALVGVLAWVRGPEAEWAVRLFEVLQTSGLLIYFGVYFILGYLMYAGIFLSIGSVCNTLKDAQNLMSPVMLVMMIPLFTMMFIPRDPNGTLATFLSWIPFYTPFIMMNRAAADPPLFDLVGTMILMVVSTAGVLWLSGKIFSIGILRTGQPPKLIELFRWLRS